MMSLQHLNMQVLPNKLLKRINKVFGKYPHSELRSMGKEYMKFYQFLHAVEKPIDITNSSNIPFRNTSEIYKMNKELIYQMKKRGGKSIFADLFFKENPHDVPENVSKDKPEENKPLHSRIELTPTEQKSKTSHDDLHSLIEYDENMAIAYLVKKMPETFTIGLRLFAELKYRFPDEEFKTLLDFGAGLGSFSMAFDDMFPNNNFLVNVEPSDPMRRLGKYISQEYKNVVWVNSLKEILRFEHHQKYDVVSVANVLEEVPSPENRLAIIKDLWDKVKPNGFFIL